MTQQPTLHIISLGVQQPAHLADDALLALQQADGVIGSARQWQMVQSLLPDLNTRRFIELPSPLEHLKPIIAEFGGQHHAQHLVVLASGDGLFYGIGTWLNQQFPEYRKLFYPNLSSIQVACHALGIAWQDLRVVSLHGRPIETLRSQLANKRYYGLFTDIHSTPTAVAQQLSDMGYAQSRLWLCEKLGYPEQKITSYSVTELLSQPIEVDPLNVIILHTLGAGSVMTPEFPGIADNAYLTDGEAGKGLITKKEVRLAVLNLLQPAAEEIGWDIGAGCGGVTVEWARWNRLGKVIAIEKHALRFDLLQQNILRFGVTANIQAIFGRALENIKNLANPDCVFIGGSGGDLPELLTECWSRLNPNGRLVVSAVTENSKLELLKFVEQHGITDAEWSQIAISRQSQLAGQLLMRPQLPVTLVRLLKPCSLGGAKRNPGSFSIDDEDPGLRFAPPRLRENKAGTLFGVGVGPGDPELITLKADRLIRSADVIAYITNADGFSLGKSIAQSSVAQNNHAIELPIYIEMCRDRIQANQAYDEAAAAIANELSKGHNVVFLCEGDPLFYGSFAYLLERLTANFSCEIVPGISSIHSATAFAQLPLSMLTQSVAVLNGRCSDEQLLSALDKFDNLVILKAGTSRVKLLDLFERAGRSQDVVYLENISREDQRIESDISQLEKIPGPYFSLFLVSANKARAEQTTQQAST